MIGLYLLSIVIAWVVAPRGTDASRTDESHLKLVFAAAVVDQAWRQRTRPRSSSRGPVARATKRLMS